MRRSTFLLLLMAAFAAGQVRRVDEAALRNAGKSGEDWPSYGLTQGETRYSPLNQISAANVSRLGFFRATTLGPGGGPQEATPLVHNGVVYAVTNWSVVLAISVTTGEQIWKWDPEVNQTTTRSKLCCGVVNRGLAMYQNMIIVPVNDGRLQALDMTTGRPVWEARVAYSQDNYTLTMAPRIAGGKVIVGVAGGDKETRGYFDAYDAATGRRAWRFYTVPGDPSKPFENEAMKKAAETWEGEWWKMGGGAAVWDAAAYDPDADLIYVGTGNAEPWPGSQRQKAPRDNLYVCSILAVKVSTGELKWHYQTTPGDEWDFDNVQHLMLADLNIGGRQRKVIMQAAKNGFYFVLDRITGEFISAEPYARVNWTSGYDPKTGRPNINEKARYGATPVTIFPSAGGAHSWSPMSFNPNTGLVYIPMNTGGSFVFSTLPARERGPVPPNDLPIIGPEPTADGRGALLAWDPVAQKTRWRQPGGGGRFGGTLSTAGNLVFQSINDGRLLAYTADKGEKLWEINTGLRDGMGPPITFMSGGKQYIAVLGGQGQPANNNNNNAAASTAPVIAPKLLTFVIDGTGTLPDPPPPVVAPLAAPAK